ncbi:hypothetical protein [Nannocystis pusilla]|uniref:hypothetical protein n=1 Tax=Nannocystis pusilla TaxID=889268 RepID=UPI003B80DEFE
MAPDSVYLPDDLALFDILSTPVWIVDLERGHQWWANLACVPMWGAESRVLLLAASAAGPGPSPTSRLRLEQLQRRLERGERAVDRWTLYPDHARPFVAECRQQAIRIARRRCSSPRPTSPSAAPTSPSSSATGSRSPRRPTPCCVWPRPSSASAPACSPCR